MGDYDVPYMPEGSERRFDLTIPILLLVLVFFVVAWKVGWLAGIPIIGDILGGKTTSILLVGDDLSLKTNLDELATEMNVNYNVLKKEELNDVRNVDYLNQYDVVILTEELDESNPMDLKGTFRKYLAEYLGGGGKKLILYKLAGSRDPDEPNMNGWAVAGMDDFIPVECQAADKVCVRDDTLFTFPVDTTKLKIYSDGANSPIVDGYTLTINFGTGVDSVEAAIINTVPGAKKIVGIDGEIDGKQTSAPAVVEKDYGVGGKTIYFAYHPSETPTLFRNTIKYLVKGGQ